MSHPFIPPSVFLSAFSVAPLLSARHLCSCFSSLPNKSLSISTARSIAFLLLKSVCVLKICSFTIIFHSRVWVCLFFFLLWSSSESFCCFNSLLVLSSKGETSRRIGSEVKLAANPQSLEWCFFSFDSNREGGSCSILQCVVVGREREREQGG